MVSGQRLARSPHALSPPSLQPFAGLTRPGHSPHHRCTFSRACSRTGPFTPTRTPTRTPTPTRTHTQAYARAKAAQRRAMSDGCSFKLDSLAEGTPSDDQAETEVAVGEEFTTCRLRKGQEHSTRLRNIRRRHAHHFVGLEDRGKQIEPAAGCADAAQIRLGIRRIQQ